MPFPELLELGAEVQIFDLELCRLSVGSVVGGVPEGYAKLVAGDWAMHIELVKLIGVALILRAMPTAGLAEEDDAVVELSCDWKVGEQFHIDLVKQRHRLRDGVATDRSIRTPIDVTVKKKTETGYVIEWAIGQTEVTKNTGRRIPEDFLAEFAKGVVLQIRTDEFGTAEGLENLEEVRRIVMKAFNVVIGQLQSKLKKEGAGAEELAAARQMARSLMTPAMLQSMLLQEAAVFTMPSCGSFDVAQPAEGEDVLPNRFGGQPFKTKFSFTVKQYKPQEHRATIEWKQALDPETTQANILATLQDLARRAKKPPPTEKDIPAFEINDTAVYVYDTANGWPLSVTYERSILSGEAIQRDRMEFKVSFPDSR